MAGKLRDGLGTARAQGRLQHMPRNRLFFYLFWNRYTMEKRPRAHWPEIALSEAFHRSEQLGRNQQPPKKFPIQCTPQALSPWFTYILDLPLQTGTTAIWNALPPIAMDRDEWDQIVFPGNLIIHSNTADVLFVQLQPLLGLHFAWQKRYTMTYWSTMIYCSILLYLCLTVSWCFLALNLSLED